MTGRIDDAVLRVHNVTDPTTTAPQPPPEQSERPAPATPWGRVAAITAAVAIVCACLGAYTGHRLTAPEVPAAAPTPGYTRTEGSAPTLDLPTPTPSPPTAARPQPSPSPAPSRTARTPQPSRAPSMAPPPVIDVTPRAELPVPSVAPSGTAPAEPTPAPTDTGEATP